MSFFNELKRRNVFRVGAAYVVFAWLVAQVLQLVFESFGTPDWVMKTVLTLLAVGLPVALFFAWAFEMTPEGLKRESEVDRSQSITRQTGRKLNNAIIGVLVLALVYFVVDKFVLDVSRDAALVEATKKEVTELAVDEPEVIDKSSAEPENSIAVLPFVNMSGDEENEYFSDGLTEELLNSLARIKELKVTGRTSSFAFKGKNTDLRDIGQTLGVAHILEGSVRKAQNRVRITAQLIKAEDGYHMWSDTFDRELDDIFAIQEEIATHVAGELSTTLLGGDAGPLVQMGTRNAEAYETYLRGRYLFTRSPDDIQVQNEAEQLFDRALEIDPQFTLAWFGRFSVLSFRQRSGGMDYQQGAAQMRQLADRMIDMDPQLPQSHIAQARAAMIEMRWTEAGDALHKALALSPGNVDALNSLGGLMSILDRKEESLKYMLEAKARDPLDIVTLRNLAGAYVHMGRCGEADEVTAYALSLAPAAGRFRGRQGRCRYFEGEFDKAVGLYEQEPVGFIRLTGLATTYYKLGQQDKARQSLEELIELEGEAASYQYGQIYAQWGEAEKSLDALEHARSIGDTGFVLLNMDRHLDPVRGHPRFEALMEKWREPSVGNR